VQLCSKRLAPSCVLLFTRGEIVSVADVERAVEASNDINARHHDDDDIVIVNAASAPFDSPLRGSQGNSTDSLS
jgi:hypothetical protein